MLRPAYMTGMLTGMLFLAMVLPMSDIRSAEPAANGRPRARDLGIPFEGTPGRYNAITDVAGVEVGHTTLVAGDGPLAVGRGPVRTGVTALFPRGREKAFERCLAAWYSLNGNGEMTGVAWVEDAGYLRGPVAVTNTHSVGVVRDAVIAWHVKQGDAKSWHLPVVAETYDGFLNDINGFHVKPEHVWSALDGAAGGPVAEGNVGGGTGMICHDFKGGIGTASRVLPQQEGGYTVGVLVQANYGARRDLRIAGVPVGPELSTPGRQPGPDAGRGSIIILVATDAPLIPTHLKRLLKRAAMGLARNGSIAADSSGDIFLAFSTANPQVSRQQRAVAIEMLPTERITPLFRATIEATEEAVINALVAAETMTGRDGNTVFRLPHEQVQELLQKYGRLAPSP